MHQDQVQRTETRCIAPRPRSRAGATHQDQVQCTPTGHNAPNHVQCTNTRCNAPNSLLFRILPDAYLVNPDGEIIGFTGADKNAKIAGCEGAIPHFG